MLAVRNLLPTPVAHLIRQVCDNSSRSQLPSPSGLRAAGAIPFAEAFRPLHDDVEHALSPSAKSLELRAVRRADPIHNKPDHVRTQKKEERPGNLRNQRSIIKRVPPSNGQE